MDNKIDETLHNFVTSLHAYSNGKGKPTDYQEYKDQAKAALKQLFKEEWLRMIELSKRGNSNTILADDLRKLVEEVK